MLAVRRYRSSILALLFLAGPAPAQGGQETPNDGAGDITTSVVTSAWADPAKCNRANAKRVAFDEVVAHSAALDGACVAVEGYWVSSVLLRRATDKAPSATLPDSALKGRRIGIYARGRVLERAPRRPTRYEMVGRVGRCETQWPGARVLGYCRDARGPILIVARVRRAPGRGPR